MSIRANLSRVAVLAIPAALVACNESPTHPVGCYGAVTVNVTPSFEGSGKPRFDWSPRCGITNLTVIVLPQGIGDPAVVWDFSASESAQIAPPVVYGHVPAGATSQSVAQPLQAGITYRVSILSTVGGDAIGGEAQKTFVP
ncbi:MAG TPA: hypothetical protein VGH98_04600 [Gemmatimonadaceae bacterium]|jgi:hypothetical protein